MSEFGRRDEPIPYSFNWTRDFQDSPGRRAVRQIADVLADVAREIRDTAVSGRRVFIPVLWRGGLIPFEGITYALERMGFDWQTAENVRWILPDKPAGEPIHSHELHVDEDIAHRWPGFFGKSINVHPINVSAEEADPSSVSRVIAQRFDPPPGSVIYYVDEALGGNVSRLVSKSLSDVASKAGAELRVHLLVSHDGKKLSESNAQAFKKLKADVFLHPVARVDWMDHAPILGWNWGRDIVFPKARLREIMSERAELLGLEGRALHSFGRVVERHLRFLERSFEAHYAQLKGPGREVPELIFNARQYHDHYLRREHLVHTALFHAFSDLHEREKSAGNGVLFGQPIESLYAVKRHRVSRRFVDWSGKPTQEKPLSAVHVGGQPVEFASLGGRLLDPHVYHIRNDPAIPTELKEAYAGLVHDPTVLLRLPEAQAQAGQKYRSQLLRCIRTRLAQRHLLRTPGEEARRLSRSRMPAASSASVRPGFEARAQQPLYEPPVNELELPDGRNVVIQVRYNPTRYPRDSHWQKSAWTPLTVETFNKAYYRRDPKKAGDRFFHFLTESDE